MKGSLAIVFSSMARTGFDFVGEVLDSDSAHYELRNPLVMDYGENRTLRGVAPLHMPFGIYSPLQKDASITLPMEGIAYVVELPMDAGHEVVRMYREFFTQKIPSYEDVKDSDVSVEK